MTNEIINTAATNNYKAGTFIIACNGTDSPIITPTGTAEAGTTTGIYIYTMLSGSNILIVVHRASGTWKVGIGLYLV